MKNVILFLLFLSFVGCATTKPTIIVPKEEVKVVIKDSVVIRDSVRIIPVERIKDIVPEYDTLKMQTSLAKASAWVDTTTHTLQGAIENKEQTQIQYKVIEKIVEKTDTIKLFEPKPYEVVKEIPYVPQIYKYALWFSIGVLLFIGLKIYLKFKGGLF